MVFIEVKALAGINFIKAGDVLAVQYSDPGRCSVVMVGGVSLACMEAASVVAAKIEAVFAATKNAPTPSSDKD
jgi:hypothetical protein